MDVDTLYLGHVCRLLLTPHMYHHNTLHQPPMSFLQRRRTLLCSRQSGRHEQEDHLQHAHSTHPVHHLYAPNTLAHHNCRHDDVQVEGLVAGSASDSVHFVLSASNSQSDSLQHAGQRVEEKLYRPGAFYVSKGGQRRSRSCHEEHFGH